MKPMTFVWVGAATTAAVLGLAIGLRSAAAGATPSASSVIAVQVAASTAPVAVAPVRSATRSEKPPEFPARMRETPDLLQTDPELDVPGGGESHCGPVAASNALVWLSNHGFPRLLPPGATERERQLELVRRLSTIGFMRTNALNGTATSSVLDGLHRYFEQTGHAYKSLRYQGWRAHAQRFTTDVRVPDLGFLQRGLGERSFALINAGWYLPITDGRRLFVRRGGHWLTLVAAGIDEHGKPAPNMIVVKDPAPYAGSEPADEFVRLEPLEAGYMSEQQTAVPARGYYRMTGGMHVKRDGEIAILDGVIVGEL